MVFKSGCMPENASVNGNEIVIDAGAARPSLDPQELWRYRELLLVLIQRDIAVRYQEAALGALWAVLQPLGMMFIFTIVFGRVAHDSPMGVPYPLFAFAGLLPWMLFSNALSATAHSVLAARGLVSKVYFPRLIIPLSAIGAPLLDFWLAALLMAGLMLCYDQPFHGSLLTLPLVALLASVAVAGLGSLLAAAIVLYRDVRHLLPFLLSAWLFLTPVIYPPSFISSSWRWLLYLNPMAGVVQASRSAWFGEAPDVLLISASSVLSVLFVILGFGYFRAVERRFADVI